VTRGSPARRLSGRCSSGCVTAPRSAASRCCCAIRRIVSRAHAYQVLRLEELARAGVEVIFARSGERSGTPEGELLRQFQGVIAEYERAQIRERTRRGKLHRARTGHQAVMPGAPYGYRFVRKTKITEGY
jgi:site-specific DNA recombinase